MRQTVQELLKHMQPGYVMDQWVHDKCLGPDLPMFYPQYSTDLNASLALVARYQMTIETYRDNNDRLMFGVDAFYYRLDGSGPVLCREADHENLCMAICVAAVVTECDGRRGLEE